MKNSNERLKKTIKLFSNYFEEIYKTKGSNNFFETCSRIVSKVRTKNLILNFREKPKSKNIDKFISHRVNVQKTTRKLFKEGMRIPFVLPLFSLEKENQVELGDLSEMVIRNSMIDMGCHNIADRVSISNPKKYKSIRTMFSFPHGGLQKEIKKITKGEFYESKGLSKYEQTFQTKRVIDENGNLWINHSINAIKNGSSWYKSFGEDGNDVLPITKNDNSYSQEFFDKFKNDVFFDIDKLDLQNMGIYHSLKYHYLDEFDFEDFTPEELEWVGEWLDYEWIGLVFDVDNKPKPSLFYGTSPISENGEDYYKTYLTSLWEVGEEIGFSKLTPLVTDWRTIMDENYYQNGGYLSQDEDIKYLDEDEVKDMLKSLETEYNEEIETIKSKQEKVMDEMDNPPSKKSIELKQKRYYESFISSTIDLEKGEIIKPKETGRSFASSMRTNQKQKKIKQLNGGVNIKMMKEIMNYLESSIEKQ